MKVHENCSLNDQLKYVICKMRNALQIIQPRDIEVDVYLDPVIISNLLLISTLERSLLLLIYASPT